MELVGRTLGPYQIEEKLGEGGMGAVYKAQHRFLNRVVALKILPPELARDTEFIARFRREGQAIAALEHPNIIPVYEAGEIENYSFLAMRFIKGHDLSKLLAQRGSLPLAEAISLLEQAASALDTAHQHGIIHRDIKPSNLLLEGDRLYLVDFGIAKSESGEFKTRTGLIIGTPEYMSPEQIQGLTVDQRTDIYALGVVCYQMLTGQVPFAATTPSMVIYRKLHEPVPDLRAVRPDLPAAVATVVMQAMAPDPNARFRTAGEFVAHLRTTLHPSIPTQTIYVEPPSSADRTIAAAHRDQHQHPYTPQMPPGGFAPQHPSPQMPPGGFAPQHPSPQMPPGGFAPQYPSPQTPPGGFAPQPYPAAATPHRQQSKLVTVLAITGGAVIILLLLCGILAAIGSQIDTPSDGRPISSGSNFSEPANPASQSDSRPIPAGWQVYKNSTHGFSIAYPSNWEEIDPPEGALVTIREVKEAAFLTNINIVQEDLPHELEVDEYTEASLKFRSNSEFEFRHVEEPRGIEVNGWPAQRHSYYVTLNEVQVGQVQYYFVRDRGSKHEGYVVTCTVEKSKFNAAVDVCDQIMQMFRLEP